MPVAASPRPRVQGWCPGALRPMPSGDGLVMRIRPQLGRLNTAQLAVIAQGARTHGIGVVDFTSRANLQLRGLSQAGWVQLCEEFARHDLLDADPEVERRRNIVINPDWLHGDDSYRLANELSERLAELPALPAKFGFAIDAGERPCLQQVSADLRIERSAAGELLIRVEGRELGCVVEAGAEVDALIALANWFVASAGWARGRAVRHAALLPAWAEGTTRAAPARAALANGRHPLGWVSVLPFGQLAADVLLTLLKDEALVGLRLSPARQLLFEGLRTSPPLGPAAELAAAAATRGWRIEACAGAPQCVQALGPTRVLADALLQAAADGRLALPAAPAAPTVVGGTTQVIHVSGCSKGCAHAAPAVICLNASADGYFGLARQARADEVAPGELDVSAVLAQLGVS